MVEIILQILKYGLYGSFGLSTLITTINNSSSNSRIRRKGFDIKPITNNSILENIKYGIKDYGFLIVPFYNLIHSLKQTAKKDSQFDNERMEKLTDRDRLVKEEEKKPEKTSPSKEIKEVKKEELRKPSRVEPKIEKIKEKTLDEMTCYERRDYYKKKYNELLSLHNKAKQEGKSVALLNEISHRMQPIVNEYKKANRECELEDLRTERNIILSSMNEPKQLIRK